MSLLLLLSSLLGLGKHWDPVSPCWPVSWGLSGRLDTRGDPGRAGIAWAPFSPSPGPVPNRRLDSPSPPGLGSSQPQLVASDRALGFAGSKSMIIGGLPSINLPYWGWGDTIIRGSGIAPGSVLQGHSPGVLGGGELGQDGPGPYGVMPGIESGSAPCKANA